MSSQRVKSVVFVQRLRLGFFYHFRLKTLFTSIIFEFIYSQRLKNTLLDRADENIFIVDWSGSNRLPYTVAVANSRLVGVQIARFIQFLYVSLTIHNFIFSSACINRSIFINITLNYYYLRILWYSLAILLRGQGMLKMETFHSYFSDFFFSCNISVNLIRHANNILLAYK